MDVVRPLRVEYEGAIYHVMTRGDGRRTIFHQDGDYQRMVSGLETTVGRYGWDMFSFALMPNHLHLFFRTPQPNLSDGMQYLLSGYGNWYVKRHQRPGHVFQSRFKCTLVEDESYFWTVSRYIHLNPCRGKRPLVSHPREWPWSSYPGYDDPRRRMDWLAYEEVYSAWQGEMGGADPIDAYRRFVEQGLENAPVNPFEAAEFGWLLGGPAFVDRIRQSVRVDDREVPMTRQLRCVDLDWLLQVVAAYYGSDVDSFRTQGSHNLARDVAAYLARRYTDATNSQLATHFGLTHPDSVRHLSLRLERRLPDSVDLQQDLDSLRRKLKCHQ